MSIYWGDEANYVMDVNKFFLFKIKIANKIEM